MAFSLMRKCVAPKGRGKLLLQKSLRMYQESNGVGLNVPAMGYVSHVTLKTNLTYMLEKFAEVESQYADVDDSNVSTETVIIDNKTWTINGLERIESDIHTEQAERIVDMNLDNVMTEQNRETEIDDKLHNDTEIERDDGKLYDDTKKEHDNDSVWSESEKGESDVEIISESDKIEQEKDKIWHPNPIPSETIYKSMGINRYEKPVFGVLIGADDMMIYLKETLQPRHWLTPLEQKIEINNDVDQDSNPVSINAWANKLQDSPRSMYKHNLAGLFILHKQINYVDDLCLKAYPRLERIAEHHTVDILIIDIGIMDCIQYNAYSPREMQKLAEELWYWVHTFILGSKLAKRVAIVAAIPKNLYPPVDPLTTYWNVSMFNKFIRNRVYDYVIECRRESKTPDVLFIPLRLFTRLDRVTVTQQVHAYSESGWYLNCSKPYKSYNSAVHGYCEALRQAIFKENPSQFV